MAFNRHRAPARHHSVAGSGSSHSYLDGVPFKISLTFRPPPQAGLPSELLHGVARSGAFHEEYDYDTEEGVLAWARAREEAKIKAIAERERAERARAALAAADSSSSSESDDDVDPGTSRNNPAGGADPTRETPRPPQVPARPPWQLPLAASVGNTILTPMPIQTTKAKVQSPMVPKTPVDLAMFEQVGDPFDNLELQTIDDMEELRTLLEGVSTREGTSQDPSPNPDDQPMYSNSQMVGSHVEGVSQALRVSQTEADSAGSSSRDKIYVNLTVKSGMERSGGSEQAGEERDPDMSGSGMDRSRSSLSSSIYKPDPNCDFVIEPTGDGDYVMIRSDYSQKSLTSSSLHDSPSVYANVGEADSGDPLSEEEDSQDLYTNSQVFTSSCSQPPVLPRVQSLLGSDRSLLGSSGRTASVVFNPAVRFSLPRTSAQAVDSRMTQSAYVWSESSPDAWSHPSSSRESAATTNDDNDTYSNVPGSSNPTSIMTASTPAFSNMFYSSDAKSQSGSVTQVNRTVDDDRPVFPGSAPPSDNHMYSNLPCSEVNSIMTVSMPAFSNHFYGNDLAHQQESESSTAGGSVMSPTSGAVRNARSNPDLSAVHGSQPWNPYKPLPPTPVSDLRSSSSSTESLPTEPTPNPSPLVLSPSPSEFGAAAASRLLFGEENDPYPRLSNEARTFVNKLTSMGFSRSRASRAVEKFGNDEREVLDHMFNVDKLMEKKFSPSLAEMSLQLFKNDMKKAERFLDLFQQFRELGFTSERIQTALVKHELDRDKALDYLTT
ncbi:hypothetical protein ACOMHN_031682 [Nucella lapillus]